MSDSKKTTGEEEKEDLKPDRTKRQTKEGVLTEEEELDETIDESFPASDPPGNY